MKNQSATLRDQAYEAIQEMIVLQLLKPGEKITEMEMSARLGIGRTPVREALQRLAMDEMVIIRPRSQITIAAISIQRQANVIEFRATVEQLLIRCAIARADDQQRISMQQLAYAVQDAGKMDDIYYYLKVVATIQRLLCEAARNATLHATMRGLYAQSLQFTYLVCQRATDLRLGASRHADILRSVAARDEPGAIKAFYKMIDYMLLVLKRSAASEAGGEVSPHGSLVLPERLSDGSVSAQGARKTANGARLASLKPANGGYRNSAGIRD